MSHSGMYKRAWFLLLNGGADYSLPNSSWQGKISKRSVNRSRKTTLFRRPMPGEKTGHRLDVIRAFDLYPLQVKQVPFTLLVDITFGSHGSYIAGKPDI